MPIEVTGACGVRIIAISHS